MAPTAILLAAGSGTRLGRGPKALLPYKGQALLEHLAGELRAGGCTDVVIVLGAGAGDVRQKCRLEGCRVVENPDWAGGMASSFRAGVAAAADADAVLVALVDQPGVSAALVRRLLEQHRPGRITAAGFRAADGPSLLRAHPLVFDAAHAASAAGLATGDAGARAYLSQHPELIDLVDCSDLGSAADIDTEADLPLLQAPQPEDG